MIITTFEQFRNLPHNRGRDGKVVYKEWLLEEAKIQMILEAYTMPFEMQFNNYALGVYGPAGALSGGSTPAPVLPTTRVTYYTPNGTMGPLMGYYDPDLDDNQAYYIYV